MPSLSIDQKVQIQISALSTLTAYALFAAHCTRTDAADTISEITEALIEDTNSHFARANNETAVIEEAQEAFAEQVRSTVGLAVSMAKKFGKSETDPIA